MTDELGVTYSEDAILDPTLVGDWHYDESGYYSYVLINGSLGQLVATKKRMREAGIPVAMSGRSNRPADNRERYEWYIRLDRMPAPKKVTKEHIEKALGTNTAAAETASRRALEELKAQLLDARTELAATVRQLNEARDKDRERTDRVAAISAKLEKERRKAERLQVQHETLNREYAELHQQKRALDDRILAMVAQLDNLKDATQHELLSLFGRLSEQELQSNERVTELQRQLSEERGGAATLRVACQQAEQAWEEAEQRFETATEKVRRAQLDLENQTAIADQQLNCLKSERDQLAGKVREMEAIMEPTPAAHTEGELRSWLRALLPQVDLTEASASYLRNEVPDPIPVFRELARLSSQPQDVRGNKVEAVDGWFELHFNTGENDLGRLYYKHKGNSRVHAHIGHKDTQPQDIGELKVINRELAQQATRRKA